jgi:hypothetical protein
VKTSKAEGSKNQKTRKGKIEKKKCSYPLDGSLL